MILENRKASPEHTAVHEECRTKMCGQTILANARMTSRSKEVVSQATFYHPPAEEALETDQTTDASEFPGHRGSDFATGDEIGSWEEESETDDPTPQAMCPFHKVDLFELVESHVGVEEGELRGGSVFGEFAVPVGLIHGWHGACDWPPFGDAETVG